MNVVCGKMSERFTAVQGVLILIIKNGKILMLLRKNKFDAGLYSVPGGCLEDHELVTDAAVREVKEEVDLDISGVEIVSAMHRICDGWQSTEFVAVANKFRGEPKVMEADKSYEVKWLDLNNLPQNISKYAKKAIDNYINKEHFSEIDY